MDLVETGDKCIVFAETSNTLLAVTDRTTREII